MEWEDEQPTPTIGSAKPAQVDDDGHGAHVFLYVPDITMETGWSTHRVPDRVDRQEPRRIGFHR